MSFFLFFFLFFADLSRLFPCAHLQCPSCPINVCRHHITTRLPPQLKTTPSATHCHLQPTICYHLTPTAATCNPPSATIRRQPLPPATRHLLPSDADCCHLQTAICYYPTPTAATCNLPSATIQHRPLPPATCHLLPSNTDC